MFRQRRVKCPSCSWSDEEGGEIVCTCYEWANKQDQHWHFIRQGKYCYNYSMKEE